MTDSDRLTSDQVNSGPENEERGEFGRGLPAGSANKRHIRILILLTGMFSVPVVIILVLMWLTPNDNFLLHFKVKADPLDDLKGWFLIRPEAGQRTELFTLAVARGADIVQLDQGGRSEPRGTDPAEGASPPERPAAAPKTAQEPGGPGSALMMVGCVEGRIMPPTFAFSHLIPARRDYPLPHPPKPCALRYRIDDSEELHVSCIFDGIVASPVQAPGPRDYIQDPGRALLEAAGRGRRLTIRLRTDTGQALTAHFDVSQLALAQVRLQRECGRP